MTTLSRRRLFIVALPAAVIIAVIVVFLTIPRGPFGELSIPTAPANSGSGSLQASVEGHLGAAVHGRTACLWIDTDAGVRVYVQWPHGWSASPSPLRLIDDRGQTVAQTGDRLTLTGGSVTPSILTGCPEGSNFSAVAVSKSE